MHYKTSGAWQSFVSQGRGQMQSSVKLRAIKAAGGRTPLLSKNVCCLFAFTWTLPEELFSANTTHRTPEPSWLKEERRTFRIPRRLSSKMHFQMLGRTVGRRPYTRDKKRQASAQATGRGFLRELTQRRRRRGRLISAYLMSRNGQHSLFSRGYAKRRNEYS